MYWCRSPYTSSYQPNATCAFNVCWDGLQWESHCLSGASSSPTHPGHIWRMVVHECLNDHQWTFMENQVVVGYLYVPKGVRKDFGVRILGCSLPHFYRICLGRWNIRRVPTCFHVHFLPKLIWFATGKNLHWRTWLVYHSWISHCIAGPKSYDSSTASGKGGKGSKGGEPPQGKEWMWGVWYVKGIWLEWLATHSLHHANTSFTFRSRFLDARGRGSQI